MNRDEVQIMKDPLEQPSSMETLYSMCVISYLMQEGGEEAIPGNCRTWGLSAASRGLSSATSLSLLKCQPSHQHHEEAHFLQAKKAEKSVFPRS